VVSEGGGKPKGKGKKKKGTLKAHGKKEVVDTATRFFSNYEETPHMVELERSYLQYLEAEHAK